MRNSGFSGWFVWAWIRVLAGAAASGCKTGGSRCPTVARAAAPGRYHRFQHRRVRRPRRKRRPRRDRRLLRWAPRTPSAPAERWASLLQRDLLCRKLGVRRRDLRGVRRDGPSFVVRETPAATSGVTCSAAGTCGNCGGPGTAVLCRLDLRGREPVRQPGIGRCCGQPAALLRRPGVRRRIHLLGGNVLGMRQPRAAVCGTTCSPGAICDQQMQCSACGAANQACCAGYCSAAGTICAAGKCAACGGTGQPCCAGSACSVTSDMCMNGACGTCGGNGLPCCGGTTCAAGTRVRRRHRNARPGG